MNLSEKVVFLIGLTIALGLFLGIPFTLMYLLLTVNLPSYVLRGAAIIAATTVAVLSIISIWPKRKTDDAANTPPDA